ncbi:terminase small subunit [Geomicrobium sp. JCM 19055]|uniref:terminase small subunit n=1 Tax=Geomicrobium sp. JCM 19055 TaxID=1460649 RepID=UPI002236771E|nr:terminase small subunit [Geomicrobium sp. JCM 19055]
MLENPRFKPYIEDRLQQLQSERVADQQEILEYLKAVIRGEHKEETLRGVGEGAQTISDTSRRLKAAELLGKRYAMWTEKQEVSVEGAIQFVDDIGDEDGN